MDQWAAVCAAAVRGGDKSVYDALVRMAQDFSMSQPLVHPQGNFGSIDPDPAAAMRYTECRLHSAAEAMLLQDIDSNAVDFTETFDASQMEPTVLPARLPNLLINGSNGIAVGMATSIPPHSLREVAEALCVYAQNPQGCTLEDLLKVRPTPSPRPPRGYHEITSSTMSRLVIRCAMTAPRPS